MGEKTDYCVTVARSQLGGRVVLAGVNFAMESVRSYHDEESLVGIGKQVAEDLGLEFVDEKGF